MRCPIIEIMSICIAATPAIASEPAPLHLGSCVVTHVQSVGSRLEGQGGSGSAISYTNGIGQISYNQINGIDMSRTGDAIELCLTQLPRNCPPGDTRGKIYRATNLRTHQTWEEADSEHSCGGA